MNHAINITVEADEQAELGRILDFAFNDRADRVAGGKAIPRVGDCLLKAKRDAALFLVDFKNDDIDFQAGRNDLAGVDVLLGPAHFRNVDKAFNT